MDKKNLILDAAKNFASLSKIMEALASNMQVESDSSIGSQSEKKEQEITLEMVRGILADKSRAGHTAEVRAIIQKYGADRLSKVDPEHYAAIIQEAEVL
jgi:hypothetical protein